MHAVDCSARASDDSQRSRRFTRTRRDALATSLSRLEGTPTKIAAFLVHVASLDGPSSYAAGGSLHGFEPLRDDRCLHHLLERSCVFRAEHLIAPQLATQHPGRIEEPCCLRDVRSRRMALDLLRNPGSQPLRVQVRPCSTRGCERPSARPHPARARRRARAPGWPAPRGARGGSARCTRSRRRRRRSCAPRGPPGACRIP